MLLVNPRALAEMPQHIHELERLLIAQLVHMYERPISQIVHYTSCESLVAILSSGNFRVTHFQHLNDSTEMLHGRKVMAEVLGEEVDRADDIAPFFDFCNFFLNDVADSGIQYFVSSFSALRDSPLLWSRYGAGGTGAALVLQAHRMTGDPSEPSAYHIARITYDREEQLAVVRPLVQAAKAILWRYVRKVGYDLRDPGVQMCAVKLCSHLAHHSISLKDSGWRDEQEWRTVFSVFGNESAERKARIHTRADGRPYVDVPIHSAAPSEARLPLVRVVAGPAADVRTIRDIVQQFGYGDIPIIRSKVSRLTVSPGIASA